VGANRGWYSRGYLPHIDVAGRAQFLTWRLGDAVPKEVIDKWYAELAASEDAERKKEISSRIERYCDSGHGACVLRDGRVARIVQEVLFHDHERLFDLHAWVVMPNHVHTLVTPLEGISLERITRAQKSISATKINKAVGRSGELWQTGYFDKLIRDDDHFARVFNYIEWNAVKAGLCSDPKRWEFSSANEASRARLNVAVDERMRKEGEAP